MQKSLEYSTVLYLSVVMVVKFLSDTVANQYFLHFHAHSKWIFRYLEILFYAIKHLITYQKKYLFTFTPNLKGAR